MKKIFLTLILLVTTVTIALAQQFKLSGTIKDTDGQPVPFASVYLKNTTKGTSANIDGFYRLAIDAGAFTIVYKAIGYKAVERNITITEDASENVVLSPETYTLSGVTISA